MSEGQNATVTVGAALAEALARAGVKIAFTVPGESLLGLLDGLAAHKVRVVTTRHEGAASFMAGAVAQLTGRPTLVLAGRAPGAANLTIGLHAAYADSAPVIAIVGQVRREVRGREAFQEMELVRAFEPIVKWAAEAKEPGEVAALGERAVATAMKGRPGPVLLSIPEDLLDLVAPSASPHPANRVEHQAEPDPALVRKVLHLLLDARRPLIVAGAGILRARSTDALVRFAETVQIPVVASWRRGDVFPNDNPLYLGMTGLGSPASVRSRLAEADALLVLGCRMGEMTTYRYTIPGAETRWAQVDIEPRGAAMTPRAEIVMAADVSVFLRMAHRVLANAALDAASFDARRLQNGSDRQAFEAASTVGEEPWDGPGVHPGRVVATLGRVLPPEAVVTTDAGDFGTWAARGYRFRRPGTFLGSTSGAMGYGLPAAIGATLARPGRLGVALAGDGGFAMTMAELETAVRERAHVIAIVFDNGRYGMIWRHQVQRGGPGGLATGLGTVDFAAIAEACGAMGISVNSDEAFEPALRQAMEAGRPALLHLALDPRWTTPDAMPSFDEAAPVYEPQPEAAVDLVAVDLAREDMAELPVEASAEMAAEIGTDVASEPTPGSRPEEAAEDAGEELAMALAAEDLPEVPSAD
ncbi:MAG: thiamine pyrophosphate-dependent enzyme [Candidatus Limnocylindrales bacterium]